MDLNKRGASIVAAIAATAALAAGCGSGSSLSQSTNPQTTSSVPPPTTSSAPPPTTTTTPPPDSPIGSTKSFSDNGTVIEVTPTRVFKPTLSQYETAPAGKSVEAVQWTYHNAGSQTWTTDPEVEQSIITQDGQQAQVAFLTADNCTTTSDLTLTAGSTQQACVMFAVPDGTTPDKLQYNADLQHFGEWSIP
jgi:hypothetical protein